MLSFFAFLEQQLRLNEHKAQLIIKLFKIERHKQNKSRKLDNLRDLLYLN